MGKNSYIRTKRDSGRTASLTEAARTFLLRGAVYYAAIALAWPHPGFGQFSPCSARFREALARAVEQDRVREADSLYTAYESLCDFDASDLLSWMRIKNVLGETGEAGRIACTALRRMPHLSFRLRYMLLDMLKDAPADTQRAVLRQFGGCALSPERVDTAEVRLWLSAAYFGFGLYDEELSVVRDLDAGNRPTGGSFTQCAMRRLASRRYAETIAAARLGYRYCESAEGRSSCAILLYESFAKLDKDDSAALWLGRAAPTTPRARAEAAAFFQQIGNFDKARGVMEGMGPSLTRDTLTIRGLLLEGKVPAAIAECERIGRVDTGSEPRGQVMLWKARALLFGGMTAQARALADSIQFFPAMGGAHALVSLKYLLHEIRNSPRAWPMAAAICYAAWKRDPRAAAAALDSSLIDDLPNGARRVMLAEGVKTLIDGKLWTQALAALKPADSASFSSELRYYRGVALVNAGEIDAGRLVFEQLLLRYPGDVFSEKARTALSEAPMDKPSQKQ